MSDEEPSVAMPLNLAMALIALSIIVPILRGGFRHGSLMGAAVAFAAAVPAGYVAWRGTQSKAQGKLVAGIVLMLLALAIAGLLVVLRIIRWVH